MTSPITNDMDETMKTYVVVDAANLFFRSRYVVRGELSERIGLSYTVMLNSMKKMYRNFNADHIVLAFEGRSWRKTIYDPYKRNRDAKRQSKTISEQEEDFAFGEAFDELTKFFTEKTNVTVLQNPILEGDDLIATWVQQHLSDQHIIVSSDTDFIQLVSPNVSLYDGMKDITYKEDGIYNNKNRKMQFTITSNAKIKIGKPLATGENLNEGDDWRKWYMFLKIIRGDPGDNVFSAFPGARIKGTKNKVGIREAYEDSETKGFSWNNFMLQRWEDMDTGETTVLKAYERNLELIDLTCQPDIIKEIAVQVMTEAVEKPPVKNVGTHFMKLCGKYDMPQLADESTAFGRMLSSKYAE